MIELASAGWALALPPPGRALTPAAAAAVRDLAAACPGLPPDAPFILVRAGRIDERLGPAVLVARPGRAVLYCPGGDITDVAARGPGSPGLRRRRDALARARPGRARPPGRAYPSPAPAGMPAPRLHQGAAAGRPRRRHRPRVRQPDQRRARRRDQRPVHRVRAHPAPAAHCAVPGPRPGTLPARRRRRPAGLLLAAYPAASVCSVHHRAVTRG